MGSGVIHRHLRHHPSAQGSEEEVALWQKGGRAEVLSTREQWKHKAVLKINEQVGG
jgi:hypothetical protein